MAGKWKETSLAAVMDVKHGFAFPGKNIRDEPPGDILLTPGNFAIGGGFKGDKFKYFDGDVPDEYVLNEGELLVTMTDLSKEADTLGYPALVPVTHGPRFLHNQRLGKVVIKPGAQLDKLFLFYLLRTDEYRHEVLASATGTTVKHTSPGRILAHKTTIPPLIEQQAIACILGALDDKIELNRRMNRTLEEMARAIFKSWFVDFDPVRAKAAGQQPPSLKPEIATLFPDSFEESELGEIPKGWRVGRLGDLVENVIKRVQPSAYTESIPYVPIECIDSRTVCLSNSQPGEKARSSLTCFQEGDILFGAMRPYFHKVCIAPFEGTTRTTAFILRPKATELAYVALVISRDETIDYATAHSEGSTIPYAKWAESLQDMRIIIPPQGLRCSFHRYVRPFIQRMMVSVSDNKTLAELRDTLLPKLISGELRLPDAERIAGRLL